MLLDYLALVAERAWIFGSQGTVKIREKEYFVGSQGFPAEKAMAPHSRTLAWKIPWTEEPGGLQSMSSPRVGHD